MLHRLSWSNPKMNQRRWFIGQPTLSKRVRFTRQLRRPRFHAAERLEVRAGLSASDLETGVNLAASSEFESNTPVVDSPYATIAWRNHLVQAIPHEWLVQVDGMSGTRAEQLTQFDNILQTVSRYSTATSVNRPAFRASAVRQLGSDGLFLVRV